MENFLRSNEYWSIIDEGIREPSVDDILTYAQRVQLEAPKLKYLKLMNYLCQVIHR